MNDIEAIARGLTKAQRDVVLWHPTPRAANAARHIAGRGIGDLWRKGKEWGTQRTLLDKSILERRYSRGEELFRLTTLGLAVRAYLLENPQ